MQIRPDDLTHPAVHALLSEHLSNMHQLSPRESVHALDLAGLRDPSITFWTAWDGDQLLGCAALRQLDARHGEVKSMRTPAALRRRGAGKALLTHLIGEARARGYTMLRLETGAQDAFAPALALYTGAGFIACDAFGDYRPDRHSRFLQLAL